MPAPLSPVGIIPPGVAFEGSWPLGQCLLCSGSLRTSLIVALSETKFGRRENRKYALGVIQVLEIPTWSATESELTRRDVVCFVLFSHASSHKKVLKVQQI